MGMCLYLSLRRLEAYSVMLWKRLGAYSVMFLRKLEAYLNPKP
jgi:hypothetical protein